MLAEFAKQIATSQTLWSRTSRLYQKRSSVAVQRAVERLREDLAGLAKADIKPLEFWRGGFPYLMDAVQRSVLFWDAMRQRGNVFLEHEQAGKPPLLSFEYETVMDARTFARPVNYALLRITPPKGVVVDDKRRPYIIIDPRAGHGPGIGGFKDDSQVGVALRAGHPVYFVIFFPQPEPGQTLPDVSAAERMFVAEVRRRHPQSPKPVLIGNCQGGWAAMMLAAADPEDTGPVVINGAPMSYWGGAFSEGEGDNPMRYSGGMLGGSWLASMTADMGNGIFDGAWLVDNFEKLHPSNTLWDKYYHLYANVDTELPRFLGFERWWGGFFLMNREEIEWIVRNLFVGNKLWDGSVKARDGEAFDLRNIRAPIVLFASMGDNITPPQQAFNWVADVYTSTEDIKARGQVIVGLLHESVGHLGIFVSGGVAKKEHAQIVSVLKSIESLPPGLYGMRIKDVTGKDGKPGYEVEFIERRLEEVAARLNRADRKDEQVFEAVAEISEFNQRAYELFLRPWVQAMSNEHTAKLGRVLHPLRMQRWALSDLNPWLSWLAPAAENIKAARKEVPADDPWRVLEKFGSELISTSLDFYRDMRDARTEHSFFQTYGNLFSMGVEDKAREIQRPAVPSVDLPQVKVALANIDKGGYPAAIARAASLLQDRGAPLPLSRIELKRELQADYSELLPDIAPDSMRPIRGMQDIICQYAPKQAVDSLPALLTDKADRARFLTLLDKIDTDPRIIEAGATAQQKAMLARIRGVLGVTTAAPAASPVAVPKPKAAPRIKAAAPAKPAAKPVSAKTIVSKAGTPVADKPVAAAKAGPARKAAQTAVAHAAKIAPTRSAKQAEVKVVAGNGAASKSPVRRKTAK